MEFKCQGCGVIWELLMVLRADTDVFLVCECQVGQELSAYDKQWALTPKIGGKSVYWKAKNPTLF